MGRLDGKVAVVTGGTQGIGRGIVLRFLKEGAQVVYCSRNPANNAEMIPLIAAIRGGAARARYVQADVGVKTQIQGVVHEAVKVFGRVDIVVNNAQGIAPLKPILEKPDEDYAMTLATGFYHSLWTMQAAVPYIRRQKSGGSFINFSSHWALNGMTYSSDYNITKGANEALTRSAANEFGGDGINVNCILPGTLDTPENRAAMPDADFSRWVGTDALADVVLFLVTDAARAISGAAIPVYGRS